MQIQQTGISFKSKPPGPEPGPDSFREGISDTGPSHNQLLRPEEMAYWHISYQLALCCYKKKALVISARGIFEKKMIAL